MIADMVLSFVIGLYYKRYLKRSGYVSGYRFFYIYSIYGALPFLI